MRNARSVLPTLVPFCCERLDENVFFNFRHNAYHLLTFCRPMTKQERDYAQSMHVVWQYPIYKPHRGRRWRSDLPGNRLM